jgi:hypothetical protein
MAGLNLQAIQGNFKVCRLGKDQPVPPQVIAADWFNVSRTADELSIVVSESVSFEADSVETDWAMLKLDGPFAFDETGVIAGVSKVIAAAKIGIFVVSTFDTDYVLVKRENLARTLECLNANGYTVTSHA